MRYPVPFLLLVLSCAPLTTPLALGEEDREDTLYSSFGKRDPFRVPDLGGLGSPERVINPVRKFRLESYRLRAVLRIGGKPQAMFEDPDGKSHVVYEGDKIGMEGARVSRIINSEVIVTERSSNYLGKETLLEKVIALPTEAQTVRSNASTSGAVQQGGFNATPDEDENARGPDQADGQAKTPENGRAAAPSPAPAAAAVERPAGVPVPATTMPRPEGSAPRNRAQPSGAPPQTSFRGGE